MSARRHDGSWRPVCRRPNSTRNSCGSLRIACIARRRRRDTAPPPSVGYPSRWVPELRVLADALPACLHPAPHFPRPAPSGEPARRPVLTSTRENATPNRKGRSVMSETPTQNDWTKPAAMAVPKGGFFKDKVEQGRYGADLPENPGVLRLLDHREDRSGHRGEVLRVREKHRDSRGGQSGRPRGPQAALPALEPLRDQGGHLLPVHGHLRHRFRQVHRGRGRHLCGDGPAHGLRESRGLPQGLEDEPRGIHQVRARPPSARLSWSTANTPTSRPTRSRRRSS